MALERIVVNTGPLIALARIGSLDVAGRLPFEFICPNQVRKELDEGEVAGYPRIAPAWLTYRELSAPIPRVSLAGLDAGEAAVIHPVEGIHYHPELVQAVLKAAGE